MTEDENQQKRPRIALITNHGYAGVNIPVGGAADTGGQNFYVNSKALALEKQGMEVTIFTRGGFPFFRQEKMRLGEEKLSDHVRYVYMPGGPSKFLRKEDIAPVLREEAVWLTRFICDEAKKAGIDPWDYYECIDTHYWDAAIIAATLVERWQDQLAYNYLKTVADGIFAEYLAPFAGNERHRQSLAKEITLHLGTIARQKFPKSSNQEIVKKLIPHVNVADNLSYSPSTPGNYRHIEESCLLGQALVDNLQINGLTLPEILDSVNRHVWTPHSTAIIKERNYWDKSPELVRTLKFQERTSHEEWICSRTPLFCSTSPEVWTSLYSHMGQPSDSIINFPPCLDTEMFKPRDKTELTEVYQFLSERSGIPVNRLKAGKIIFESSRMDRTKRKDLLLKAFSQITDQLKETFLFIGGGPNTNPVFKELQSLKESLPTLEERAFLTGFIPSAIIKKAFSVPDLFVSASEMEGFGMSVSQAAACKVAIVSSDLVPFSTQFAQEAAVIIPAGDTKGFADAMVHLLKNDEERKKRAEALYEIALQLNWENATRKFINFYRHHFNLPTP